MADDAKLGSDTAENHEPLPKRRVKSVKPKVVIDALSPHYQEDLDKTYRVIPRLIREGELRIYARTWESRHPPSQKSWSKGPPKEATRTVVSHEKFVGCKSWFADAQNWKWKSGKFYLSRKSGKSWLFMDQVRFLAKDVEACIERIKLGKSGTGGVRRRTDDWTIAIIRLIDMARKQEFTVQNLKREKIFDDTFKQGLKPETKLNLSHHAVKPLFTDIRAHFLPILKVEEAQELTSPANVEVPEEGDLPKSGE